MRARNNPVMILNELSNVSMMSLLSPALFVNVNINASKMAIHCKTEK